MISNADISMDLRAVLHDRLRCWGYTGEATLAEDVGKTLSGIQNTLTTLEWII